MSTKLKLSDFKALYVLPDQPKHTSNSLYHALLKVAYLSGDVVTIDEVKLQTAFRDQFATWVERNPGKVITTEQPTDELWQATQAAAKLEANKTHVQKHADEAAARYFSYWVPKGLIDNQQNRSQIFAEMEKRETRDGNIPSAALLDVVIPFLSRQGLLQFKQPPVESLVVVPPPLPPVLIDDPESPTGKSEQLSLSEQPRSRHSKAQLRDWDARRRAEQQRQLRESNNAVTAAFRNVAAVSEIA